jgi:hypothetical protein
LFWINQHSSRIFTGSIIVFTGAIIWHHQLVGWESLVESPAAGIAPVARSSPRDAKNVSAKDE